MLIVTHYISDEVSDNFGEDLNLLIVSKETCFCWLRDCVAK